MPLGPIYKIIPLNIFLHFNVMPLGPIYKTISSNIFLHFNVMPLGPMTKLFLYALLHFLLTVAYLLTKYKTFFY